MRFSAVRGNSSPVNGFRPSTTLIIRKPGIFSACSVSRPSSDVLMSSRTFPMTVVAKSPTRRTSPSARWASPGRVSGSALRFPGWMAAQASEKRLPASSRIDRNVASWLSSQSAVCCSVPRSRICSRTASLPMRWRKPARISTVGASTGTPRNGSLCSTFVARRQTGPSVGSSVSSGSTTPRTASLTIARTRSTRSETSRLTSARIASTVCRPISRAPEGSVTEIRCHAEATSPVIRPRVRP